MVDTSHFNEDAYEQALIALFRDELGYQYVCGYEVERDYREPYYRADLEPCMQQLNPTLPKEAVADGIYKLTHINCGTLEQNNEQFTRWLQNGVEVNYKEGDDTRTELMQVVDYAHPRRNLFRVVNQWRVEEYKNKRADMVVMVNGLPLVVIELKSAVQEDATVHDAYLQIRNYQQSIPCLFTYNAFNVISDLSETRAGTITAKEERYMEWKSVDGTSESDSIVDYHTLFCGMFDKVRFLDILRNFICFDKDQGSTGKILTAYHQYFAVNKALERTYTAVKGDGKIGVFWHTQGSGKSLSMVFYAHLLVQQFPEVTIVVVTDRKDLDNQLFGQFSRCSDFLRQKPVNAKSRDDLAELLLNRKSGGIIFTTIQKFEDGDTALSMRKNIIVMSDEAHRSQYGVERWDTQSLTMKKGYSQKMREALPGASFIGFTGTPISDRDRDTQEVFGSYIDVYDMSQAVDDGATRPVYYESRVVNLNLDEETLQLLDHEFDEMADEGATEAQIKKAKQEHSHLEVLLGHDNCIDALTRDIIKHYEENRAQELTGKAMIVALTRSIAIKIYRKMIALRPEWTEKVKVVMSSSNKDPEDWQEIIGNEKYKQELARKFKDNSDPMKIAIVRDMWLTGFDVPSLATMYVYKPMTGHNLMQAIARVNRVFPGKEGGLIVDYVGIAQSLKRAMQQYTNRDRRRFGNPDIAQTAFVRWQEELEICQNLLYGYNYEAFFVDDNAKRASAIVGGVDSMSAPQKVQQRKDFMEHSAALHNATTLCRSLLNERQKAEECYMHALRVMLLKLAQKGKLSKHEINERISELLRQSVHSEGVVNLFNDKQVEFSLFDEAFMQEVRNMKERNLAVELLQKLMREKIKVQQQVNVIQSDKYSDMLNKCLSQYMKGLLTNEAVIEELLQLAAQMQQEENAGNDLGLTPDEKAFYDALSTPEGVRQAFSDEQFIAMTKEMTDTLQRNRTIDWQKKESARAQMRLLVKRLLRKYKYPPEKAKNALETVMRQCEHWADTN